MGIIFFWFLFAIAVGIYASNKGRSGFLWFLISLFISPLITFIFIFVMKDLSEDKSVIVHVQSSEEVTESGSYSGNPSLDNDGYKIYLTKRYKIHKNDVLNKFVCGEKLYETVDEALLYANQQEQNSINYEAAKRERQRELEKQQISYQLGVLFAKYPIAMTILAFALLIGLIFLFT